MGMDQIISINDLKPGESGKIKSFSGPKSEYVHLLEMGLLPGANIQFMRKAPLGDAIQVKVQGVLLSIRCEEAKNIHLEVPRYSL